LWQQDGARSFPPILPAKAWSEISQIYHHDEEVRRALVMIERDFFNLLEPGIFRPIVHALLNRAKPIACSKKGGQQNGYT
jgi:hypothetical protein